MRLPKKTSLAIVTFLALAAALRLKSTGFPVAMKFGKPEPVAPKTAAAPPSNTAAAAPGNPRQVADPSRALDRFYAALHRTELKEPGAITRVLHYGDSPVTADSITADARAILQTRFGDAGHGFVLIAKPWAWYGHRGIQLKSSGWRIAAATQSRAKDGFHGLGGVSFEGNAGASSTITLPDGLHTLIEVDYLKQPGGGTIHLEGNEHPIGDVNTGGDEKEPGFAEFALPPGTDRITLTVNSGAVRLFGWSFEKDGPGLIYHSLGLNGAQVQAVLRYFDAGQWAIELQHQHPDLVVINYGTNESVFPEYIERQYPSELRRVIERVKAAVPDASVLVMSPMDRGERDSSGAIVTVHVLPRIVEIQKQIASETGCAFFNTYEAMGGAGTMARWYDSQPRLVSADFMHPLPGGAAKVGALLDDALVRGYARYQAGLTGTK
jgi:lysophospholipase L1-like esterase